MVFGSGAAGDSSDVDPVSPWAHFGGLFLWTRRLVDARLPGRHAGTGLGRSLDWIDHRPYAPGDDVRQIDWKRYGRTNRYFVRRQRLFAKLSVYLLVDASASMRFVGTGYERPIPKFDHARQLAAGLAMLAIGQGDRAGLGIARDKLDDHLPAGGTRKHLQSLCHSLQQAPAMPRGQRGDLAQAARQFTAMSSQRSLVIMLSDLLNPPAELLRTLAMLEHRGHHAMVMQILSPEELCPTQVQNGEPASTRPRGLDDDGTLADRLVDPETLEHVDASLVDLGRDYRQMLDRHLREVRRVCLSQRADYTLVRTDQSPLEALAPLLRSRVSR